MIREVAPRQPVSHKHRSRLWRRQQHEMPSATRPPRQLLHLYVRGTCTPLSLYTALHPWLRCSVRRMLEPCFEPDCGAVCTPPLCLYAGLHLKCRSEPVRRLVFGRLLGCTPSAELHLSVTAGLLLSTNAKLHRYVNLYARRRAAPISPCCVLHLYAELSVGRDRCLPSRMSSGLGGTALRSRTP